MENTIMKHLLSVKTLKAVALTLALAALAFLATACQWYVQDEMDKNRANVAKLRVGMSKEEAKAVMGEPVKECYCTDKVWFYYAQPRWQDGAVTRDECTPLVFDDDGQLVGWGKEYYKANYEFNSWPGMNSK